MLRNIILMAALTGASTLAIADDVNDVREQVRDLNAVWAEWYELTDEEKVVQGCADDNNGNVNGKMCEVMHHTECADVTDVSNFTKCGIAAAVFGANADYPPITLMAYTQYTGVQEAENDYSMIGSMTQAMLYTQMLAEEYKRLGEGGEFNITGSIALCASLANRDVKDRCVTDLYTYLRLPVRKKIVTEEEEAIAEEEAVKENWDITRKFDPIDDSPSITIFNTNDNGGTLIFRCNQNTTNAYIIPEDRFFGYEDTETTYVRFDQVPADKQAWQKSTDGKAYFAPHAIALIKQSLEHEQLIIRIDPTRDSARTETFALTGLDVTELRAACNW